MDNDMVSTRQARELCGLTEHQMEYLLRYRKVRAEKRGYWTYVALSDCAREASYRQERRAYPQRRGKGAVA